MDCSTPGIWTRPKNWRPVCVWRLAPMPIADPSEILPDPDSTDRRGWWGDLQAEEIWDGWPIGTQNWLLTRAKITESQSSEGATLERARIYTAQAIQPFIDRHVASAFDVVATRTERDRIDVGVVIYRGPLPAIDLRYQILWGVDSNRRSI